MSPLPANGDAERLATIQDRTRAHRRKHGCDAYTFEDGHGLLALARAGAPGRVLELGTALGFTACLLASAGADTQVDTIEYNPEHVALAREMVTAAGFADRVTVHEGDFAAVLPRLSGPYDLALFDGLGPTLHLIEEIRDRLRPGGLIVCANLRWAGAEREHLEAAFADAKRWQAAGTIEDGATPAFRKIQSQGEDR